VQAAVLLTLSRKVLLRDSLLEEAGRIPSDPPGFIYTEPLPALGESNSCSSSYE